MVGLDAFIKFMIDDLEGGAKPHKNPGETHFTAYGVYGKYFKLPKSMQEAVLFYKKNFYIVYYNDLAMDLFLLQFSVNVGRDRAVSLVKNELLLDILDLAEIQRDYYRKLVKSDRYAIFKNGWFNRVDRTLNYLLKG